jgi:hydrogenase maturation factor
MRVLVPARADGIAICADEDGAEHEVAVDLLETLAVGEEILVHAGVAIAMACIPVAGNSQERTTA